MIPYSDYQIRQRLFVSAWLVNMTRHGKNATSNPVYTYAEKRKDCREGFYGSRNSRLGANSVKPFDACCLTLQRCTHPVVTPDGYLYDKEAILENILYQKGLIARRKKLYLETLTKAKKAEKRLADDEVHANTVGKFLKRNSGTAVATSINPHTGLPTSTINANSSGAPKLEIVPGQPVKSFWIPARTPDASDSDCASAVEAVKNARKPDENVYCPMSGKRLRVRDLLDVKFTLVKTDITKTDKERAERGTANSEPLYKCPVTHDLLNNATPCVVLRTSGIVVKVDAVEKIIRPDGMRDPVSGTQLKESDIIMLQRGGTGFTAAVRESRELLPVIKSPAMPSA